MLQTPVGQIMFLENSKLTVFYFLNFVNSKVDTVF
jgi:hypothetical protein